MGYVQLGVAWLGLIRVRWTRLPFAEYGQLGIGRIGKDILQ